MSNIYIHEPPTDGKVLMVTTLGELDIELWSKEAPLACKNFVQLCVDGYYTGTIFHRVIPQFTVQGGDRSGTGEGGESIYGAPYKLESHQRLRFSRRGLLATAGANPNDNTSQFFFTLGAHEHLNKKHTIFGQVTGDTKYNLLRFNDVQTDNNDRPLDPPKITKVQILSNPFPDIEVSEKVSNIALPIVPKFCKRKFVNNVNLLSFGDELEDGDDSDFGENKLKSKSCHDFPNEGLENSTPPQIPDKVLNVLRSDKIISEINEDKQEIDNSSHSERIASSNGPDSGNYRTDGPLSKEEVKSEYEKLRKELRAQSKRNKEKNSEKPEVDNFSSDPYQIQRVDYVIKSKKFKIDPSARQANTLAMLSKFSSKLKMIRNIADNVSDSDTSDTEEVTESKTAGDASWMSRSLLFQGEISLKTKNVNVNTEDRWDIYDPRNSMNKRRREENRDHKLNKKF